MSIATVTPELLWAPKVRGRITGIIWAAIIVSLVASVSGIVVIAVSMFSSMTNSMTTMASLGERVATHASVTMIATLNALGTQLLVAGLVIALVAGIAALVGIVADRRHSVAIPTIESVAVFAA